MGVEKLSVSFELALGEAVRASATDAGQSVSGWLAAAARDRLRLEALGQAVGAWERSYGALTEAEVAEAQAALEQAAVPPPSGVA